MPLLGIESYHNISEKKSRLAQICADECNSAVFLVPSGLDKEILLRMMSKDGSFWGKSPDIFTWSDLYRRVTANEPGLCRRVVDPPDHTLIIDYVLRGYLAEAAEEGIPLPPGIERPGSYSIVGENIRELLNEEISPEKLSEILTTDSDELLPEEILKNVYRRYLDYLENNGLADSAQLPTLTREVIENSAWKELNSSRLFVITGFLSFTGGQLRLVKKLSEHFRCIAILPETGLDSFRDAISQIGADYYTRPKWSVKIAKLLTGNGRLQFDALARELALWMSGKGGLSALGTLEDYGEIGVQVGADRLNAAQSALARYKIPVNVQVRGVVGDTLLGELPRAIWNAFESGWDTDKTVYLLSNPLLGYADFDFARACESFPKGLNAWKEVLDDELFALLSGIDNLCKELLAGCTPAQIMEKWLSFLRNIDITNNLAALSGDELSLDYVVKDASSSIEEIEKKREALADLARDIGAAGNTKFAGRAAIDFLTSWADSATLPIQLPQSRSVTLYGGMPPVLSSHKYWVITDADYNVWPGKLVESPFLSDASKKNINETSSDDNNYFGHIPEIHEERAQKEALFRRLVAAAESGVVLTRSMTDASGRPTGDSQFTEALFEKQAYANAVYTQVAKIEYTVSRVLPDSGDISFQGAEVTSFAAQTHRGDFPRVGTASKKEDEKIIVSLSALDDWMACPYRYWCSKELGIESGESKLYDVRSAGTFLHRLWEVCWSEYRPGENSLPSLVGKHWEKTAEESYPQLINDIRLKRHAFSLRKQAFDLAETQDAIEKRVTGRTKVETEYKLPDYEINGVIFRGRCDRIDFFDNEALVFDYKLGKASRYRNSLQLAAYSLILQKQEGFSPRGYGWFGHSDSLLYGVFEDDYLEMYRTQGAKKKAPVSDKIEIVEQAMTNMAESLKSGVFKANYNASIGSSRVCGYCEFFGLCRRKENPYYEEEEDDERMEDEIDA